MQGRGTFHYADGKVYVGDWLEDQREGFGVLSYPNGDKYEGQWRANKPHKPLRLWRYF